MKNEEHKHGVIYGRVTHGAAEDPIVGAEVSLHKGEAKDAKIQWVTTGADGKFRFEDVQDGNYIVECSAFGKKRQHKVQMEGGHAESVLLRLDLGMEVTLHIAGEGAEYKPVAGGIVGKRMLARFEHGLERERVREHSFASDAGSQVVSTHILSEFEVIPAISGQQWFTARIVDAEPGTHFGKNAEAVKRIPIQISEPDVSFIAGKIGVQLHRAQVDHTRDQPLWPAIRLRTKAIGFGPYRDFINRVLCAEERESLDHPALERRLKELGTSLHGVGAYEVLRFATEAFLLLECGVNLGHAREGDRRRFHRESESSRLGEPVTFDFVQHKLKEYLGSPPQLPYITRVIREAFPDLEEDSDCCHRVLTCRVNEPCLIELIWSYWHEEGMLAQTMNAVTRRFQNVRAPGDRDPLAHLEIDPLRPLNNIIWGFIQDEFRRLTVKRRAYEYDHQYGLMLYGKAVSNVRPADSRSKFLEAFHNLLHLSSKFFKEDNDTTVIADGYPLLNALKEVHLLLAQGAHNQFGDLPWTARAEMLLQQWMLSRPEIRDFLQSRMMVPYKEAWMPQVDTMKTLQGWSDVTVTHFRDLGVYGEQILLSVRYGDWIAINDEDSAKNWSRYWRPEIQGYLHAYRAATGIDLTNPDTVDATVPAVHLQKRLVVQQQRTR